MTRHSSITGRRLEKNCTILLDFVLAIEDKEEIFAEFKIKTLQVASMELNGNILIAEKEFSKGIKVLEAAVKMEKEIGYSEPPYYPRPTLISLATAYGKIGDYEKAEASYQQILKKHPNSALVYWELSKLYQTTKQKALYGSTIGQFNEVVKYGDVDAYR